DLTEVKELEGRLSQERMDRQKKIAEAILQAEERERTNLGHELHDNVNQVLTTARLYLDMVTPTDAKGADIVEKTKTFIHNAINEIRCISREMVLPNLKDQPLTENIQELLEDLKATGLYEISFVHEEDKPVMLSEEKKTALFRVLQEQLKNIIKHSDARHIDVRLCTYEGQLTFSVKDDGVGFDPRKKVKGIGLANIRDRIQLCKGRVKLDTAPGKGCLLEVLMPV
ncbi:MAG: sensor histidine kinase, partial [Bacteroidetes bacterium]|nr:sensor histidine kinase [Bacteroidota bacterium]